MPDSSICRLASAVGTPQKVADLASLQHDRVRPDRRRLVFQSFVTNIEFRTVQTFLPKELMQP